MCLPWNLRHLKWKTGELDRFQYKSCPRYISMRHFLACLKKADTIVLFSFFLLLFICQLCYNGNTQTLIPRPNNFTHSYWLEIGRFPLLLYHVSDGSGDVRSWSLGRHTSSYYLVSACAVFFLYYCSNFCAVLVYVWLPSCKECQTWVPVLQPHQPHQCHQCNQCNHNPVQLALTAWDSVALDSQHK